MKEIRDIARGQEMPGGPELGYKVKIHLPSGRTMPNGGRWMFTGGYMPPEFLYRVEALRNLVQQDYDQYEARLHPERCIQEGSDEYVRLTMFGKEPEWFTKLWRNSSETPTKFKEPLGEFNEPRSMGWDPRASAEAKSLEESKNLKLPQRD